jgi:Fe-S-cluster containining protein
VKQIDPTQLDRLPGRRLGPEDLFCFRCHAGLSCFNRCCRNLNLFLYPYDVVRLKNRLGISSDRFLDQYVDVVLREGSYFPDVLLKMADNPERTCPFLTAEGCAVYPDRPDTCRTFPVEQGVIYGDDGRQRELVHFFRPPDFCRGQDSTRQWTPLTWERDQQAGPYHRMTARWAEVKGLFHRDPWGPGGLESPKGKMAFMATYNMDRFRDFVFHSSFLKRYRVPPKMVKKARTSDAELLKIGFAWVKLSVWGIRSKEIVPRV